MRADSEEWYARTEMALGRQAVDRLNSSSVLVVGLGGVGGFAAEMVCRAGVGRMTIVDGDVVNITNRNRQIVALRSTGGIAKADAMGNRLLDINASLNLTIIDEFIRDERMIEILETGYDYVVDAIDTLSPKVFLIKHTLSLGMPLVSSMGAGGRIDPLQVKISDISESYNCTLARIVRKRLHRLGVRSGFKVVWSPEEIDKSKVVEVEGEQNRASAVGTVPYMPAAFGIACASVVIRDLALL